MMNNFFMAYYNINSSMPPELSSRFLWLPARISRSARRPRTQWINWRRAVIHLRYAASGGGDNSAWLMNGATYVSSVALPVLTDANWRMVGTGDFNNDGQTDKRPAIPWLENKKLNLVFG